MTEALRIAAMIHTQTVSGPARQLAALAQRLRRDGIEMLIVVFQRKSQPLSAYVEYLRAVELPHTVVEERSAFDLGLLAGVKKALGQFRPHIVQTHGYKPSAVAAALRLRRTEWKWIAFWHGTTTENLKVRGYHQLDAFLVRRADRLVVMSDIQRQRFHDLKDGVSVIPNAVLMPSRVVGPPPPSLGDLPRPLLGVIGRLSSEKGVDVFLHAAARLVELNADFSAVVVGDGPDRAELVALRDSLGLGDRVHFLGHLADASPVYAAIDLLVSRRAVRGFPTFFSRPSLRTGPLQRRPLAPFRLSSTHQKLESWYHRSRPGSWRRQCSRHFGYAMMPTRRAHGVVLSIGFHSIVALRPTSGCTQPCGPRQV